MRVSDLFEEVVRFDNAELKRRYHHYNTLLFDGTLPEIPIQYAKLKTVGGHVTAKVRTLNPTTRSMRRFAKRELIPDSMRMQISTFYQRDPQAMDAILIHEMIHVFFISKGDFNENHGGRFITMCRQLGQKVGFDIPLTDDVTGLMMTDAPKRKMGVIIVTKKNGQVSVAVVNEAYIRDNLEALRERWQYLVKYNYAQKVDIVVTTSRIEGRYPIQRKKVNDLRYYLVKEPALIEDAMEHAEVLATITA